MPESRDGVLYRACHLHPVSFDAELLEATRGDASPGR
jgi:hypothetical protein